MKYKRLSSLLLLLLLLSRFSRVWLCATQWTAAHQAPPSLGFSRQEHWSGLPFPSPMGESEKWKWSCSVMSDYLATPWTAAFQAPVHGILQARVLECVAKLIYYYMSIISIKLEEKEKLHKSCSSPIAITIKHSQYIDLWLFKCTRAVLIRSREPQPHSSPFAWKIPWTEEAGRL